MRSTLRSCIVALALLATLPAAASAAPSCAEGPETVGNITYGTPCDDTIRLPRSVTTVFGEGGDDTLYGQRGNDRLYGGEGDDRLYGGIGDDRLRGGPGADRLYGGFGADSLDGEAGDDFARGDATIDRIQNTDGGVDTLSYATGVTPGFPNQGSFFDYEGFPAGAEGRGAYIDLAQGFANNGLAPAGGGVDLDVDTVSFERVIGTPFPDFIVGSANDEAIYGGGGADVILGEGGADQLHGGAEGDSCEADPGSTIDCERSDRAVEPRDAGAIAVGRMEPGAEQDAALYLTGSTGNDVVLASYAPGAVIFTAGPGSAGAFDSGAALAGDCEPPAAGSVVCAVEGAPDSIVLAGLGGSDELTASGFPPRTSVVVLGNGGNDDLTGDETEDVLVDGSGDDIVAAGARDDAVPNNEGEDDLDAGSGEDLFVSDAICDGDGLDGGPGRDNANWAKFDEAVTIDMGARKAGRVGSQGQAQCPAPELLTDLAAIEDVEGTSFDDTLVGDASGNQLLGRSGHDSYFAAAGNDHILANSGDQDLAIDCGPDFDTALIDHPQYSDPTPVECESVEARNPESFRPPDTPPDPDPEPEGPVEEAPSSPPPPPSGESPPPPSQARDRTPPQTRIRHRPSRRVFAARRWRKVVFVFTSNERGARFRCKLDRRRFGRCRSPRAYWLRPGRHAVRIFAVDAAGNRDRSPVVFRFRIRPR